MTYATHVQISGEVVPQVSELKVWKTVRLGVTTIFTHYFCRYRGFQVDPEAQNMMKKAVFHFKLILNFVLRLLDITGTELLLVVVSPRELGFQENPSYEKFCAHARKCGLDLCPVDLGLQLRSEYDDQPEGEALLIAMKAIRKRKYTFQIFEVGHDSDGQWIRGWYGNAGSHWPLDRKFVFVIPWYLCVN